MSNTKFSVLSQKLQDSFELVKRMQEKNQRLIFVRHANNVDDGGDTKFFGTNLKKDKELEKSLSPNGIEQAKLLRPFFDDLQIAANGAGQKLVFFVSPFSRTRRTAELATGLAQEHFNVHKNLRERVNDSVDGKEKTIDGIKKIYEADRKYPAQRVDCWESQVEMLVRMTDFVQEILSAHSDSAIVAFSHYNPIEQIISFFAGHSLFEVGNTGLVVQEAVPYEISFDKINENKCFETIQWISLNVPSTSEILLGPLGESQIPSPKLAYQNGRLVFVLGPYNYSMWWIFLPKSMEAPLCAALAFVSLKYNVVITGYFDDQERVSDIVKYVLIVGQPRRPGTAIQPKKDAEHVIHFLQRELPEAVVVNQDNANASNNVIQTVAGLDGDHLYTTEEALKIYGIPTYVPGTIYSFNPGYANVAKANFGHYIEPALVNRAEVDPNENIANVNEFIDAICKGAANTCQTRAAVEFCGRIMNIEFIYY